MPQLFSKPPKGLQNRIQNAMCGNAKGVGCAAPAKIRNAEPFYDMFVIPVSKLLELKRLPHNQEAASTGLLQKWSPEMEGKIIFVSHQWLGYIEPDPNNEQFSVLKTVLRRLMTGEVSVVELSIVYKCYFKNSHVAASEWREALPQMYVWIDFCCIPQVHGASEGSVVMEAARAVSSLPMYAERCAMILVLAPLCTHEDGENCNYASWRARGWCRAELMFALLARRHIRVLVCNGAAATPFFLNPSCALRLPAGEGRFSCCDLGHELDGRRIQCDRIRVGTALRDMIAAKVLHLRKVSLHNEARYFAAFQQSITRGLPQERDPHGIRWTTGTKAEVQRQLQRSEDLRLRGDLPALRALLCWRGDDEERADAQQTGFTLLFWAAFAGCAAAAREHLAASTADINLPLKHGAAHLEGFLKGATPLMAAMAYGDFGTVEVLLGAKANPDLRCDRGLNALCFACLTNNHENVRSWLQRFPGYDLDQRDGFFGDTALSIASFALTESAAMCRTLLEARASPAVFSNDGGSLLHKAAFKEDSDPELFDLLIESGCDVNYQSDPQTWKWKGLLKVAGVGTHIMVQCPIFAELCQWHRTTALHHAARRGDIAVVKLLVGAKALHLKDAQGRTPLEAAHQGFGGKTPPALEAALLGLPEPAGTAGAESRHRSGSGATHTSVVTMGSEEMFGARGGQASV